MEHMGHEDLRIGTQIGHGLVPLYKAHGFESFDLVLKPSDAAEVASIAERTQKELDGTGILISCLNAFCDTFADDASGEAGRELWRQLITHAHDFGCDIVAGFSGRLPDRSVADNIPRFVQVYTQLVELAEKHDVRLAFETCPKQGRPNIAVNPEAWRSMFQAVPSPRLGLQWEPAHQLRQLMDPIRQLREWAPRVFHVHGKDGTIDWDVVERDGILSSTPYFVDRTVSFGQSDWTEIVSILRVNGFHGSIDIEGFHDPVYQGELELTGQLHALRYLKECRGGDFVPFSRE
jgi:sugar phosphate isomerase/epimerase